MLVILKVKLPLIAFKVLLKGARDESPAANVDFNVELMC